MSSALSIDLRERVVHAVEAGASRHKAAERFGVSLASASRWCARFARVCLHAHPRRQRWSIHASSRYRPLSGPIQRRSGLRTLCRCRFWSPLHCVASVPR
nr:IS630 transposase-related protein [Methylobacterium sp. Leaf122]